MEAIYIFTYCIARARTSLSSGNHSLNATRMAHSHSGLVRDSSDVRRVFVRLAGAVGRQTALHKENSEFAAPNLGRHISTFRGYRILFSIRNPYINRFTNHFSIHSQPSYPQKVVLHSITSRICLRPYHFAVWRLKICKTWWGISSNVPLYVTHGGVYHLMSHYMTYFWDTRQNLCNFNSWRRMYNNPDEVKSFE